ncbi:MAG: hypothetical protein HZA10_06040 [Nitrospirae bacterium]|nr:hypothetical protein [Nitrospirota bacterium]
MKNTLLFNPVSIVHDRSIEIFRQFLPGWDIKCVYNPKLKWFSDKKRHINGNFFLNDGYPPEGLFDNVKALILFSAQPRMPHLNLIQKAALLGVPVIAIEEVLQMMLEQGFVNEYFLPVDHLLVASEYEQQKFIETGVPGDVVETTGCVFRYKKLYSSDSNKKEALRKELKISDNKLVAVLSLAYLTPSGETPAVRKELLACISKGLPARYELIVKPHPAEQDKNIYEFIKRHAPDAKIANQYTPIDHILDIADVLFNRGNSQVIIDALQRNVPVVAVPAGRKTFFHNLLDNMIVNSGGDIKNILHIVEERKMDVYAPIFKTHLAVSPELALEKTLDRIKKIANKGELYKPEERMSLLSIFWAFTGCMPQALKALSLAHKKFSCIPFSNEIEKLFLCRVDLKDILLLQKWLRGSYMEWILQSLWIRKIYLRGEKLQAMEREWLADYPPRMNREIFLPYVPLLYWCYIRSNMTTEGRNLIESLYSEYSFIKDIERCKQNIGNHNRQDYAVMYYWHGRIGYALQLTIKTFLSKMKIFTHRKYYEEE